MGSLTAQEARKKKYASVGIFPATEDRMSKEEMQKLFFSTTSADEYISKRSEPAESFDDIHNMGTKNGKYMTYRPSKAPLWARSICRYTETFAPKPLGDFACNKMLAETFRLQSKAPPKLELSSKTAYREQFPKMNAQQAYGARAESCSPAVVKHVDDTSKLLVTRSTSHAQFGGHKITKDPQSESFKPSHSSHVKDKRLVTNYRTRYHEDYHGGYDPDHRPPSPMVSAEDNSFRVNGASIPNKVRDFMHLSRAHSTGSLQGLPSVGRIMQIREKDLRRMVGMQDLPDEDESLATAAKQSNSRGVSALGSDYAASEVASEAGRSHTSVRSGAASVALGSNAGR